MVSDVDEAEPESESEDLDLPVESIQFLFTDPPPDPITHTTESTGSDNSSSFPNPNETIPKQLVNTISTHTRRQTNHSIDLNPLIRPPRTAFRHIWSLILLIYSFFIPTRFQFRSYPTRQTSFTTHPTESAHPDQMPTEPPSPPSLTIKQRLFHTISNLVFEPDRSRLMYLRDQLTDTKCLIDTGSKVTVIPRTVESIEDRDAPYRITAANGQQIKTYGTKRTRLQFHGKRFTWTFIVADVRETILGIDFLRNFEFTITPHLNQISNDRCTLKCNLTRSSPFCLKLDITDPVLQLLEQFPNLTNSENQPIKHNVVHYIHTGDARPIKANNRHYNPKIQQVIRETFDGYLKSGYVRPSSSEWSSPLAVVRKKTKGFRCCGDFRLLNKLTKSDNYPMPYLLSFNSRMFGSKFFSKIDLETAYHQIPVFKEHICKTAVSTPNGLFEFVRCPYGLKTAGNTWQRLIDGVLRELFAFLYVFVDDIVVFSETKEQHLEHLRRVFQKLSDAELKININKSEFCKEQISFLGFDVDRNGVRPSKEKVEAIRNLPLPNTIGKLKTFLGMINYFCHSIKDYAAIRHPLNRFQSTPKSQNRRPLRLNRKEQRAFEQLRQALFDATLLAHPDPNATLVIHTDASSIAVGASLSQLIDLKPQPLYLFSKRLPSTFLHKPIYYKELEAVYLMIKKVEKYLMGQKVILYVDNEALAKSISNPRDKPDVELRKLMYISEHIDEVVHVNGATNFTADYLSRIECNSMIIEPQINYHKLFTEQLTDPDLIDMQPDENLKKKNINYQGINYSVWFYENLQIKDLIYVPASMVNSTIAACHNLVHPGQKATVRYLANKFYWPTLKKDTKRFVKDCLRCQTSKKSKHQIVPVSRINVPANRFEHIHLDLVGPLPLTEDGHLYLLTIIDRYSRFFQAIPIKSKTAKESWSAFARGWIQYFGLPKTITMDRGSNFKSKYFTKLCKHFGIRQIHTCSYHPEANGLLEGYHHKLKNSLRALADPNWSERIPIINLIWNNVIREDGLYSPSQIVFGTNLLLPNDFFEDPIDAKLVSKPTLDLIRKYMSDMSTLRSTETNLHRNRFPGIISKDLQSNPFVFEVEHSRTGINPTYRGPFEVLDRKESYFTIQKPTGPSNVSIQHLKPAYGLS